MIMEYQEVMKLIEEVSKYGSVMGIDSIRDLMTRLDSPEESLKIIHVAGTNGKGSTCAFLSSVLTECGYTVGRFSTPDVFCYEEKFRINGENISGESLCYYYNKIENACRQMVKEGKQHPTLFEMETAIAICYAADKKCDYLLLEVGMGGLTDATNYISKPLVSVITSISMDHMEYLGNTLEDIARIKAGIMKEGCPVVSVWQEEPVKEVLEKEAKRLHCPFYYLSEKMYEDALKMIGQQNGKKQNNTKQESLRFFWKEIPIELSMQAVYQIQNAMTALQTIDVIKEYEKDVDREYWKEYKKGVGKRIAIEKVKAGMVKASSPGRFTKVSDVPEMYIDGAHNPGAVKELVKTLQFKFKDRQKVFIIGVFKDKDYESMLRILSDVRAKVIAVTLPQPRGLEAETLADAAGKYYKDVFCAQSIREAIKKAVELIDTDEKRGSSKGMILAFGSLSYLKEVAAIARNSKANGNYLKKLLQHPVYQKKLCQLKAYESTRVFCKHDVSHFEEMGRIAIVMMKKYGVDIEEETVLLAAYLHDMGRVAQYEKGIPHDQAGVEFACKILHEIGYPMKKTETLTALIDGHRSGGSELPVRIFAWADKRSRACYACEQTAACKWSKEKKNQYAFTDPEKECIS